MPRGAFLAAECGPDAELRARVDRLLAAHDELGEPGADRAGAFAGEPPAADRTPQPDAGTLVAGRYKLIEEIGEGGMGTVWLAHQTEPVRRTVAVKLIKAGMDSRAVLARFDAERQALALMDHPNIAKVLDAGATADGRPFFVMELVKGVPVTKFCDEKKLTPKERLELFVPVCHAIQHAHQKGVIHRDIKPGNVLVALYDDKPVAKVIDFGVAKATGHPLTEHTFATGFGSVIGTPEYMSPEQASFNNLDIDTRSDVYALGVLLYELLAGSPPFSRKELKKVGLLEIFRVIREQEPPRPSDKLSTADARPLLAANRGTDPKRLTALLRGELDWIAMKALEKDRARRYESANGFAADVQRYLAGEAVQAVPPSAGYRLKKFLRRNKGPALAAGAVFLTLVVGIAGTTWGLFRADKARGDAVTAKKQEVEQREAAERAAEQAVASFRKMTDYVVFQKILHGENAGRFIPPADREYVRGVLKQWEALAAIVGDGEQARAFQAEGAFRVAQLQYQMGDAEAEGNVRAAIERYEKLVADYPDRPGFRRGLADSLLLLSAGLEMPASLEGFQKGAAGASPLDRWITGSAAERAAAITRARDLYTRLHADAPDDTELTFHLADVCLAGVAGQPTPAGRADLFRRGVALLADLERRHAADPDTRFAVAKKRLHWGRKGALRNITTRPDVVLPDGDALCRQGLAGLEALAENHGRPEYGRVLADQYTGVIDELSLQNRREALALSEKQLRVLERLAEHYSRTDDDLIDLCAGQARHAELTGSESPAKGVEAWAAVIRNLNAARAQVQNRTAVEDKALQAHIARAELLESLGRHAEAAPDWSRVVESCQGYDRLVARLRLAGALAGAEKGADAVREVEAVLAASPRDVPTWERGELEGSRWVFLLEGAKVYCRAGKQTGDERHYARALALLTDAAKTHPEQLLNPLPWGVNPFLALRTRPAFQLLMADAARRVASFEPPPPPPKGLENLPLPTFKELPILPGPGRAPPLPAPPKTMSGPAPPARNRVPLHPESSSWLRPPPLPGEFLSPAPLPPGIPPPPPGAVLPPPPPDVGKKP